MFKRDRYKGIAHVMKIGLVIVLISQMRLIGQTLDKTALFDEGLILYRNQQYDLARGKFLTLVSLPKPNRNLTKGFFMLAKSSEKLGKFEDAANFANVLLNEYPSSRYVADAYFILGSSAYQQDRFVEAIENFILALETSQSPSLSENCENVLKKLIPSQVIDREADRFYASRTWKKASPFAMLWLIKNKYAFHQTAEADRLVTSYLATSQEPELAAMAARLQKEPLERLAPAIRIGVALPLSGYFSDEAHDLLKGMAFALKNRSETYPQIDLIVEDTQGTTVGAVQAALALLQKDVTLIIGELEGAKSAAIAGLTTQSKVPLLVPVATENGIAGIGNLVFQGNGDLETRGAALARYAFDQLKMRTFATFAPADDYGHAFADGFTSKIDELGGTIISQQWYYPGEQDFKHQFENLRAAGIRYALRDSIVTRGKTVTSSRIDSLFQQLNRAEKMASDEGKGLIESYQLAINSIDGIFFPVYEEDMDFIVPQFALSHINARPLGGDNWINGDMLRKHRNQINGAVMVAGNYFSEIDLQYKDFVSKFRLATQTSPGMMAVYGYNAISLLLQAIDHDRLGGGEIADYIKNCSSLKVLGGFISFQGKTVNQTVSLLQFQDGNIIPLNNTK